MNEHFTIMKIFETKFEECLKSQTNFSKA